MELVMLYLIVHFYINQATYATYATYAVYSKK